MPRSILISVFILLFVPSYASATFDVVFSDRIDTKYRMQIVDLIDKVETYFKDEHGLEIERAVTICVVHGDDEYSNKLRDIGIGDYVHISKISQGVTFRKFIVVNANININSVKHVIAHEITHQYQFSVHGIRAMENMLLLEGTADYIGFIFGEGLPLNVSNRHIDGIYSLEDWKKAINRYGRDDIYSQALYEATRRADKTGKIVI